MRQRLSSWRLILLPAAFVCLVGVGACGGADSKPKLPAPGSAEPDKFLFDRGNEAVAQKKWLEAREYFRRLIDTYPQSQYRQDAKLGVGDSYMGENNPASDILAINEYREFLRLYALNPRADYAEFQIGVAYLRQMLSPKRDQTSTHDAITQFEAFLRNHPASTLRPQAEAMLRQAKDRLDDSEFEVGLFYFRYTRVPVGAVDRLKGILETDPEYTRRDEVYFYLAESLMRLNRPKEALPYYAKLVEEFPKSPHIDDAKKRMAEIKH